MNARRNIEGTFALPIPTEDGEFWAEYSESGLCGLTFPQAKRGARKAAANPPASVTKWHGMTTRAVEACLAGKAPKALPPLDLRAGTDFQQKVWGKLSRVATGKAVSYSELAASVGRPGAARAVGGACGANPIPVLIPCHRVLAANRRLGGFSGGLDWKRRLLAREGVQLA